MTEPITDEQLTAIEAAAKAATQGTRDGEVIASLCPERVLALVARLRRAEADLAALRAENERLREGLATFGIREVTCGQDDWFCGECEQCKKSD